MTKRTWKGREIGADRIREVIHTSRSLSAAAHALGVNRSTLHRWIQDDPSLKEKRRQDTKDVLVSSESVGADVWAAGVEGGYVLTSTDRELLDLARRALAMARDDELRPAERISAMGRFQRLVDQLHLDDKVKKEGQSPQAEAPRAARPERGDPRSILRAVV